MNPNLNSEITKVFCDVFEDKSWKLELPVLDYADMFAYPELFPELRGHAHTTLVSAGLNLIRKKYPNLPKNIYMTGACFDFDWAMSYQMQTAPSMLQADKFLAHVENKLATSKVFPYPDAIPDDIQCIAKIRHGLRLMCHDIYQPLLYAEKTKPQTFHDQTVGVLRQCPTMLYDQPNKIFDYYPFEFLMVMPYFTMPRIFKWLDAERKFSLIDLYLPENKGLTMRHPQATILRFMAECLFKSYPDLGKLSCKLIDRAMMVSGGGFKDPPPNFGEFMLARDRARRMIAHHLDSNIVHLVNITNAIEESSARHAKQQVQKSLDLANQIAQLAKTAHIQEFGK